MFHSCLCHRGTWGEQFTTLTTPSNLQRMLLVQRLHRSPRSLSGPSCQRVSGEVVDCVKWMPPSKKRQHLKYWCCDWFCFLMLFTSFFLKEQVGEQIWRFPLRICVTPGRRAAGCQASSDGDQLRGGTRWSGGVQRCSHPAFSLQIKVRTPAEQSSCNYNASMAALIFAQL